MQLSFDFIFDTDPAPVAVATALRHAENAVVERTPVEVVEEISVTPQEPGYFRNQVTREKVDFATIDIEKTVILERGRDGFRFVPLSRSAGTKLLLLEQRFEQSKKINTTVSNRALSSMVLGNINLPMGPTHPIAALLSQYGLDLVISQAAVAGLDRIRRDFKRMMTPFKFHVPVQFKDLQGSEDDIVRGPFVADVYPSEVIRYRKRLEELGLVDPNSAFSLYPYQAEDVALLATKPYAFINHDMGLGKTLIAAALIQMHGYERVLIVAPAPALGSWQSGWRHELERMGIPKDHIHVIDGPEDLPADQFGPKRTESFRPFQDKPHVYLVDYNTLAKEKWDYLEYACTTDHCRTRVPSDTNGRCPKCRKLPDCCPSCYEQYVLNHGFSLDPQIKKDFRAHWNGRRCSDCGFQLKVRVSTQGRIARAQLLMGQILKKKTYGKQKNLTPQEHAAIDTIPVWDKLTQVVGLVSDEMHHRFRMLLSPKPLWKHIHHGMFKFLLLDESHMVKDNSTRRGNAIQMIRGLKRCYIMTGTMLTNYVSDSFWQLQRLFPGGAYPVDRQLLDFSAHKGMKKGEEAFLKRFEGRASRTSTRRVSRIFDESAFWGMMARVQLRRHDDDPEVNLQVHLPEAKLFTEFVEMDPYHRNLYRMKTGEFQQEVLAKIRELRGEEYAKTVKVEDLAPVNPASLRSRLQELRQVAACPDQTGLYAKKDGSIRMTTKDARILELVQDGIQAGEKTVVFCSWISQIERLKYFFEDQNIPVMILDGRVGKSEKWEKIDEWRTSFDAKVLLASIGSVGQSVNLTSLIPEEFKCRRVIFGSPEWAPYTMEQAWCRVYRIGQTDETQVHFLYHKNTIEEEMDELLYQKRITIAKALDRAEVTRTDDVSALTYQEIATRILNKYQQEMTS